MITDAPPAAEARAPRSWTHVLPEAALVTGVGVLEIVGTAFAAEHQNADLGVAGVALLLLGIGALPFRRRHPVATLGFILVATLTYASLGYPDGPIFLPLIIALGQVVFTGHRVAAVVSLVIGFVGFSWLGAAIGRESAPGYGSVAALAAWLIALLSVMEVIRIRRDRAHEAAVALAEATRRQVSDERLRIARELHDAVAHSMSLINIQSGVALHLMDDDPAQVRDALVTIKEASKEALVELRSILGVLRHVDEDAPRAPTPSLRRLDDLVGGAVASGLDVDVDVDGDIDNLPRNVDLAAFRIIQESLTNVARHSDRTEAVVRVRSGDGMLDVEILDEGSGRSGAPDLPGGGNGIAGIRERAASVGGQLQTGPRPGRGFAVRAQLPIGGGE